MLLPQSTFTFSSHKLLATLSASSEQEELHNISNMKVSNCSPFLVLSYCRKESNQNVNVANNTGSLACLSLALPDCVHCVSAH